ncbi:MAG: TetR/AcrR family transcriptional regulator [Chloroflexota bacterium]
MEIKMEVKQEPPKTVDRRVQRTQNLLLEALVALIQTTAYDEITVQDIIDRANVGRSTFYSHFLDKDQLLLSGLEKVRVSFEEQHRKLAIGNSLEDKREKVSLAFFTHVETYHQLYKAVLGKRSNPLVTQKLYLYLSGLFRQHLNDPQVEELKVEMPLELAVQFLTGSLLSVVTWWLENNLPYSAEQMNRWFHQLAVLPLISTANPKLWNSGRV